MADTDMQSPDSSGSNAAGDPSSYTNDPPLPSLPHEQASTSQSNLPPQPSQNLELRRKVDEILYSDIGINTLLDRLKQSLVSARDLSSFLKERSHLEERHANGLKKLCKGTHDTIRRPDSRHGSFSHSYGELTAIQERLADNGTQFAISLYQMSAELNEMAANVERGRKHWKHTGLTSEQRFHDADTAAAKAKGKYDMLADQYDRARTGDRQAGRFNLKTKSAAQQEEDLHRKMQAADADYATKVQAAQAYRQELVSTHRPQAVRAMRELVRECDSAVALHLQKFATLSERLLLGNGLCVSPIKSQPGGATTADVRSQRDVISTIDNEKDFREFVLSFSGQPNPGASDTRYEKHPALHHVSRPSQAAVSQAPQPSSTPPPAVPQDQSPQQQQQQQQQQRSGPPGFAGAYDRGQQGPRPGVSAAALPYSSHSRDGSLTHVPHGQYSGTSAAAPYGANAPYETASGPMSQMPGMAVADRSGSAMSGSADHSRAPSQSQRPLAGLPPPNGSSAGDLPPLNPVFGISLDEIFRRYGQAVPSVVQQCTAAVDAFGLDAEGIYRTSGSTPHMLELKARFDHDASQVDLLNPDTFQHEISSVTTLLKQFFRSLPDPLLTTDNYTSFITAAQISDEVVRRDSLHAIINDLPDPNYATLRHLTLHLYRVSQHVQRNRMTPSNLAIVFGPTLMGANPGLGAAAAAAADDPSSTDLLRDEASWQCQVVETIILSTFQIFDADDDDGGGEGG